MSRRFHASSIRVGLILLAEIVLVVLSLPVAVFAADELKIEIVYVTRAERPVTPLTLVEPVAEDLGVQGARLALQDNATTGSFLGHDYQLREVVVPRDGTIEGEMAPLLANGIRLIVADLEAEDLEALADLPEARDAMILNARARHDRLRVTDCRANTLHVAASDGMLTDALGQYLRRKRWDELFLIVGRTPADARYAEALRRAVKRYQLEVVEEEVWTFDVANRRTDSGVVAAEQEVHGFTQVSDYDVLVVADVADQFGEYLPHRTARPRPVAGTQGLVPSTWSRVHEQWGGTQLQGRFEDLAGRFMTERDYANWLAVRAIGEAVTRTSSNQAQDLKTYMLSPEFELQGFKGLALTFRPWNQQLRQRVLLAGPRILVSVSPQPGFLHQRTELDTLGYDQPESACDLNQ